MVRAEWRKSMSFPVFKSDGNWDMRPYWRFGITYRSHLQQSVLKEGKKRRYLFWNLMKIEICAILCYYAAVTIPYRRFGITYWSHLQQSVLKEGKKRRYLFLNLMKIEICALLGYYAGLTIPYRCFGITYPSHLQRSVLNEGNQCSYLCLNLMEVEIFALLGYYAGLTFRHSLSAPSLTVKKSNSWPLKMGPIAWTETTVRNTCGEV